MKYETTEVPSIEEIDVPAIQKRYKQERDRRLRPDGQRQYARVADDVVGKADACESDPWTPWEERESLSEDIDVAVIGGGWSGLLAGVYLRKAGISSIRNIDQAGGFGGVWYWNRYPGIQCDNDAYCYLPMLEEMGFMPTQKYADGREIRGYMQQIADRFDLQRRALFHTLVKGLSWDESSRRWSITTDRGDDIRARFVIMANGLLNIPKLPNVPGIHEFRGKIFHTSRWDYAYTGGSHENPVLGKLSDKRVAIVGTGATAIQAIPYLGRHAKKLYVLVRTPPAVDVRPNRPTDPEWVKTLKPGWQKERQANFQHAAVERMLKPGEPDLVCDFWTEITRNLTAELQAEGWPELTLEQFMERYDQMDIRVMQRMRDRVDTVVKDKRTAEALKPWFGFWCKRPLSNNQFYQTFNRPNVELIDVSSSRGIERVTGHGFMADGIEHEVDCMIFGTGFEVTSDLDRRWGIENFQGRGGISIYDHWADGYKTLHGLMTHGFPNMFFIGYYQGGLNGSTTEQYNMQVQHSVHIVKSTLESGAAAVEPSQAAQDAWVKHIRDTGVDMSRLQNECTPGYYNNDGQKHVTSDGKEESRWFLGEIYGPGWEAFVQVLEEWREKGAMDGLVREGVIRQ